jgi:hypothetical protein
VPSLFPRVAPWANMNRCVAAQDVVGRHTPFFLWAWPDDFLKIHQGGATQLRDLASTRASDCQMIFLKIIKFLLRLSKYSSQEIRPKKGGK